MDWIWCFSQGHNECDTKMILELTYIAPGEGNIVLYIDVLIMAKEITNERHSNHVCEFETLNWSVWNL